MTPLDDRVRPILNQLEIWTRFGIHPVELGTRVTLGTLIELPTPSGELVYPEAMFDRTGQPPLGLEDVLDARDRLMETPLETAVWLNTPHEALGDRTPYEVMSVDPVAVWFLALVTREERAA